jgi:hypothetical protein
MEPHAHPYFNRLIQADKKNIALSNASEEILVIRLTYVQAQRYWIERNFQDGKFKSDMRKSIRPSNMITKNNEKKLPVNV